MTCLHEEILYSTIEKVFSLFNNHFLELKGKNDCYVEYINFNQRYSNATSM